MFTDYIYHSDSSPYEIIRILYIYFQPKSTLYFITFFQNTVFLHYFLLSDHSIILILKN